VKNSDEWRVTSDKWQVVPTDGAFLSVGLSVRRTYGQSKPIDRVYPSPTVTVPLPLRERVPEVRGRGPEHRG
jgi:hypothetical protein